MQLLEKLFSLDFYSLDNEEQSLFYADYYSLVYKQIYFFIKDKNLIDEIVQDSLMIIISKGDKYKIKHHKAWLATLVKNMATKKIMLEKKHKQTLNNGLLLDNIGSSFHHHDSENSILNNFLRDEINKHIFKLNSNYVELIFLFYFEGLSYREISELLELSECAVSQKLARARKKLHKILKENNFSLRYN